MSTSFGSHLVEDVLPAKYHGRGPLTKAKLHEILVEVAKDTPADYSHIVTQLKRIGDEVATLDGISVGLDDIAPDYKERDAVLTPYKQKFKLSKGDDKLTVLREAQSKLLDYTKNHTGVMAEMARSGGRGNMGQLMKTVGSPVLAHDDKDHIIPWFVSKSYAEGLKPSDAWVTGTEARVNEIRTRISVVEPGDLAKILVNNMSDKLITMPDCGTRNGISMPTTDAHIIDRYLAHAVGPVGRDTLITPQVSQQLKKQSDAVIVRSPMTCEAPHGICQKCQGLDYSGHAHSLGTNVGMRAAQAIAEPLTQLSLSAKHAAGIAKNPDDKRLEGIKGVRQMLEIPESFLHKATLADHDGSVTKIEDAPQGGRYIFVNDTRHYVGPDLKVTVDVGHKVEAGDTLTNGVPKPDEVVKHKGLGEGRRYLVDALHGIYKNSGVDLDRRHFETLARSVLNHVYIADTNDEHDHGFLKGDVVNYNRYLASLAETRKNVTTHDSVGETLGDNVLHFTAGTRVTPSVRDQLSKQGIKNVSIAVNAPKVDFLMKPATRTPLLNPDWMARLAHRYLKESLLAGAHKGESSDIHGYHPAPAYAAGGEFGQGPNGTY